MSILLFKLTSPMLARFRRAARVACGRRVGLPFEEANVEACGDRNSLSLGGHLGDA